MKTSKIGATIGLVHTLTGNMRYATMEALRTEVNTILPGSFPYSFEFMYWEEVGVIDKELARNLIICGIVITIMIMLMIPHPRISIWVILTIFLTVIDILGFLFWWDVTISSISTIYILISVGLSVDYAAHIAHMFVVSPGSSKDRAVESLVRIGPSVFNAIVSTFLAVVVVSFSKSYIFRVFFKALFLTVVLGGLHGLWLLPVLLSLVGGSNEISPNSIQTTNDGRTTPEIQQSDDLSTQPTETKENLQLSDVQYKDNASQVRMD